MSRVARFIDLWNAGKVHEAVADVADGYWYHDAVLGGPHDRAAHLAIMEQVLSLYPDRHIDITREWSAGDTEVVEYRWTGTADGGRVEADWVAVVEFDGDRMKSQRHYRGS